MSGLTNYGLKSLLFLVVFTCLIKSYQKQDKMNFGNVSVCNSTCNSFQYESNVTFNIASTLHASTIRQTYIRTGDYIFKPGKRFSISTTFITILLLIGGVELNPGPAGSYLHDLALGVLNVRSMVKKGALIQNIILENKLNLFVLNETWIRDDDPPAVLFDAAPSGHSILHVPRKHQAPRSRGGGLAVIYNNDINVKSADLTDIPNPKTFELQCVTITRNNSFKRNLKLLNIYRPPYPGEPNLEFYEEFADCISQIMTTTDSEILVCGDVNCSSVTSLSKVTDMLSDFNLSQHVCSPTRGQNILDIFAASDNLNSEITLTVKDSGEISDHNIIFVKLKNALNVSVSLESHSYWPLTNLNYSAFETALYNSDLFLRPENDAENFAKQINNIVVDELNKLVTKKTVQKRPQKAEEFLSQEAKTSIRLRRKLEKRWIRTKLETDRQEYRNCCRVTNRLISESRSSFISSKLANMPKDGRQRWNYVHKLLHTNTNVNFCYPVNFCLRIANGFADKLSKLKNIIANQLTNVISAPFANDVPSNGPVIYNFVPVTVSDVKRLLHRINIKPSPVDAFPSLLLKNCTGVFSDIICRLVNLCFEEGKFPSIYKTAQVTPLLKKPNLDKLTATNYRPISNLNSISKIIERLALQQIRKQIDDSKNFNPLQSAYRQRHSTETALLKTMADVYNDVDSNSSVVLVALDVSAAFDTIPHNILIKRLEKSFGFSGNVLLWLKSYLTDRSQFIRFNGENSPAVSVSQGVPQGSVLGPILFTAYISPVANLIKSFGICHQQYADDTQLYISVTQPNYAYKISILQNCLQAIKNWFLHNQLVINPDKSEAILLSTPQRVEKLKAEGHNSINIADIEIPFSDSIKTLGVSIDSNLTFSHHVKSVCQSGYFHLRALRHIRPFLSESDANTIACAFVHARLDYCNSLLYSCPRYNIQKLQRLQNSLARVVTLTSLRSPITPEIRRLHWLNIDQRIDFKIASLTFNIMASNQPSYLRELLKVRESARSERSRYQNTLVQPRTHLALTDKSFASASPKIWNSLPPDIRKETSPIVFSKKLKTHIMSNCHLRD